MFSSKYIVRYIIPTNLIAPFTYSPYRPPYVFRYKMSFAPMAIAYIIFLFEFCKMR